MWPFRRRPVLDAETAAWHVDHFGWLIEQFPQTLDTARLILPKPGFFIADDEQGHALAQRIFDQVKAYCGMADWDIALVEDDNPLARAPAFGLVMPQASKHALGTVSSDGERIQISYVPSLVPRPANLIATLAHELAHVLLAQTDSVPPCEEDEMECLTDLTAVYMGFGVFLANARFNFDAHDDGMTTGWRSGRAGYLPEADLVFALALFLRMKALDADTACRALKPHLAKILRRALRDLPEGCESLVQLRAARDAAMAQRAAGTDETAAAQGDPVSHHAA